MTLNFLKSFASPLLSAAFVILSSIELSALAANTTYGVPGNSRITVRCSNAGGVSSGSFTLTSTASVLWTVQGTVYFDNVLNAHVISGGTSRPSTYNSKTYTYSSQAAREFVSVFLGYGYTTAGQLSLFIPTALYDTTCT
jgi:hypothetical protein